MANRLTPLILAASLFAGAAAQGALELDILLADFAEVGRDFLEQVQVEPGCAFRLVKRRNYGFCRGVPVGHAHR